MLRANLNYTYGQNTSSEEPMRRIPPMYGSAGLSWQIKSNWRINGTWAYAGKQARLSSGDIDDHRIADGGTPDWNTFDMGTQYAFNKIALQAGIKNIFDTAYRMHGSGVDGIGRSFWVTTRVRL